MSNDNNNNNSNTDHAVTNDNSDLGGNLDSSSPNKSDDNSDNSNSNSDGGLLRKYDVVLCGTGLVQSILASALARCGKSILHVDEADYYGALDAVYTYPYLITNNTLLSCSTSTDDDVDERADDSNNDELLTIVKNEEEIGRQAGVIVQEEDKDNEQINKCTFQQRPAKNQEDQLLLPLHKKGALRSLRFHSSSSSSRKDSSSTDNNNIIQVNDVLSTMYGLAQVTTIVSHKHNNIDNSNNDNNSNYIVSLRLLPKPHLKRTDATSTVYISIPNDHIQVGSGNNHSMIIIDARLLFETYQIQSYASAVRDVILLDKSRSIALDVTPTFLLASSAAVRGLLISDVANYLEFKACEGLYFLSSSSSSSTTTKPGLLNSIGSNQKHNKLPSSLVLSRVPASKNDVFSTKLLSPIDKRRLMKFLQLALDYALVTQQEQHEKQQRQEQQNDGTPSVVAQQQQSTVDAPKTWNEKHLNQGRALSRPQNKAVENTDMLVLQQCIKDDISFETYLKLKQNLASSPLLLQLVQYALALDTNGYESSDTNNDNDNNPSSSNTSTASAMKKLCRHMLSLGQYGTTAFLIPLYGSGEMSQAFCRSAAVYGATYLLRTVPTNIIVSTNTEQQKEPDNNNETKALFVKAVEISMMDDTNPNNDNDDGGVGTSYQQGQQARTKRILCSHVVVPKQAMIVGGKKDEKKDLPTRRVVRRISILNGKPSFPQQQQQAQGDATFSYPQQQQIRYVVIIPPNCIHVKKKIDGHDDEKYDVSTRTITNSNPIHALFLDETVNVAPHVPMTGCTIVQLTTTKTTTNTDSIDDEELILESALQSILDNCHKDPNNRKNNTNVPNSDTNENYSWLDAFVIEEIFHVSFSYEIDNEASTDNDSNIHGLHVIYRTAPELTCDDAFEQAERLYYQICPGSTTPFLQLSKELDTTIKERFGDALNRNNEDDDIQRTLESAVGMIHKSHTTSTADNSLSTPEAIDTSTLAATIPNQDI